MEKLNLYIFAGNCGTGKTTAGVKLGEALSAQVLDPDLMRRELGIREYDPGDTNLVMRKIFQRIRNILRDGGTAILCTPYIRQRAREQSYRMIREISEETGQNLNAVLVMCECSEQTAKTRISRRPQKDHLHCPPNDPAVYDRVARFYEPIGEDEIVGAPEFSFISYDTERNGVENLSIRDEHTDAIELLEQSLVE